MKKVVLLFFILSLITFNSIPVNAGISFNNIRISSYKIQQQDDIYKDIFLTSIFPTVYKAINSYYGKPVSYDSTGTDILDIKQPFGKQVRVYDVYLKIQPFVGAHNTVGEDLITIRVGDSKDSFKVIQYKHIK